MWDCHFSRSEKQLNVLKTFYYEWIFCVLSPFSLLTVTVNTRNRNKFCMRRRFSWLRQHTRCQNISLLIVTRNLHCRSIFHVCIFFSLNIKLNICPWTNVNLAIRHRLVIRELRIMADDKRKKLKVYVVVGAEDVAKPNIVSSQWKCGKGKCVQCCVGEWEFSSRFSPPYSSVFLVRLSILDGFSSYTRAKEKKRESKYLGTWQ